MFLNDLQQLFKFEYYVNNLSYRSQFLRRIVLTQDTRMCIHILSQLSFNLKKFFYIHKISFHKILVPYSSIILSKFKILISISHTFFIPLSRSSYHILQSTHPTQLNGRRSVYCIICSKRWSRFSFSVKILSSQCGSDTRYRDFCERVLVEFCKFIVFLFSTPVFGQIMATLKLEVEQQHAIKFCWFLGKATTGMYTLIK